MNMNSLDDFEVDFGVVLGVWIGNGVCEGTEKLLCSRQWTCG